MAPPLWRVIFTTVLGGRLSFRPGVAHEAGDDDGEERRTGESLNVSLKEWTNECYKEDKTRQNRTDETIHTIRSLLSKQTNKGRSMSAQNEQPRHDRVWKAFRCSGHLALQPVEGNGEDVK